jgi:hypothetical protein
LRADEAPRLIQLQASELEAVDSKFDRAEADTGRESRLKDNRNSVPCTGLTVIRMGRSRACQRVPLARGCVQVWTADPTGGRYTGTFGPNFDIF